MADVSLSLRRDTGSSPVGSTRPANAASNANDDGTNAKATGVAAIPVSALGVSGDGTSTGNGNENGEKSWHDVKPEKKSAAKESDKEKEAKTTEAIKKSGDAAKSQFIAGQQLTIKPLEGTIDPVTGKKKSGDADDKDAKGEKGDPANAGEETGVERLRRLSEEGRSQDADTPKPMAGEGGEKPKNLNGDGTTPDALRRADAPDGDNPDTVRKSEDKEKQEAEALRKQQEEALKQAQKKEKEDVKPSASPPSTAIADRNAAAAQAQAPKPAAATTATSINDPRANVNNASRESVSRTAQEASVAPTSSAASASTASIQTSQSSAVSTISAPVGSSGGSGNSSVQKAVSSGEAAIQKIQDNATQSIDAIVAQGDSAVAGATERMTTSLDAASRAQTASEQEAALYSAEQAADSATQHVQATADRAANAAQYFDGLTQQTAENSRQQVERLVEADRSRKQALKLEKEQVKKDEKAARQNESGKPSLVDRAVRFANNTFDAAATLILGAPQPARDPLFNGVFEAGSAPWTNATPPTAMPWTQYQATGPAAQPTLRRSLSA